MPFQTRPEQGQGRVIPAFETEGQPDLEGSTRLGHHHPPRLRGRRRKHGTGEDRLSPGAEVKEGALPSLVHGEVTMEDEAGLGGLHQIPVSCDEGFQVQPIQCVLGRTQQGTGCTEQTQETVLRPIGQGSFTKPLPQLSSKLFKVLGSQGRMQGPVGQEIQSDVLLGARGQHLPGKGAVFGAEGQACAGIFHPSGEAFHVIGAAFPNPQDPLEGRERGGANFGAGSPGHPKLGPDQGTIVALHQ